LLIRFDFSHRIVLHINEERSCILTRLSLHRPKPRIQEEQPVVRLIPLSRPLGIADLVLGIVALHKILHDASRFEEVDCLAIAECVGQGGYAAVRVDCEEPGLLLNVLGDIDLMGFVGETDGVSI
jgi:hypothetical protein